MTSRKRRLWFKLFVAVIAVTAIVCLLPRIYVAYKVHRATSLLAEASRVQIGATEASILPLIKRYGGYKFTLPPLSPKDDWTDLEEYEYQKNLLSDYDYMLEIAPYGFVTNAAFLTGHDGQLNRASWAVRHAVPEQLRPILAMRNWLTSVELKIRGGRVQSVSAWVLV